MAADDTTAEKTGEAEAQTVPAESPETTAPASEPASAEAAAATAEPAPEPTAEAASPAAEPTAAPVKDRANLRWYAVHAYSGFEMKAKAALEERIRQHHLEEFFGEVTVPQETVVELVRGQKKTSNHKLLPSYILLQMVMNQDTWHLVKETPKITGFVGDPTDPSPMSDEEAARMMNQDVEGGAAPRARMSFEQGETVKVIDGPFTDFNGTIEEVKPEKGKVKVLINIFGRSTPVELDFIQVEKV